MAPGRRFATGPVSASTTEGEIAGPDEHEVTVHGATATHLAGPVDRRLLPMTGAQGVERQADREQLAGRPGERHLVRIQGVELLTGLDVDGQQAPGRVP